MLLGKKHLQLRGRGEGRKLGSIMPRGLPAVHPRSTSVFLSQMTISEELSLAIGAMFIFSFIILGIPL